MHRILAQLILQDSGEFAPPESRNDHFMALFPETLQGSFEKVDMGRMGNIYQYSHSLAITVSPA
jgi:hypothetical protein